MSKRNKKKKYFPAIHNNNMIQQNKNPVSQRIQTVKTVQTLFSGPLPHPDDLAKYESILPGSAYRILKMAESQGEHRRGLEKIALTGDLKNSHRGSWFAFIASILIIISGTLLIVYIFD